VAALGLPPLGSILRERHLAENLLAHESRLADADVEIIQERRLIHTEEALPARTTISQFFERAGLNAPTAEAIVRAARPVYNLAQIRAGNRLDIIRNGKGVLRAITYEIDRDRILWVSKQENGFRAEIQPVPYKIVVAGVAGSVRDSLFQAMAEQGEGDWLTLEIADIFGWDIDFSTDPREGDTFEVLVEKKMLNSERWGYGRVLAAQYQNEGQLHQAILFRDPSGRPAYYGPSGQSLQKAFLRSPLKFGAMVTSGFSRSRFHPILKRYRPHLGVDYAAPVGSAVQAVGDGRVVSAGWNGESGKMVRLRHARGFETYYLHLSSLLVKPGQQVRQGQIIGKSGSTGLATGPHLDFRVTRHGQFVNFLRLKLPPAESVARKDWNDFVALRTQSLDRLASLHPPSPTVTAQSRVPARADATGKTN
jgi:murein DD-endopeptidase MepM/ murein hydrolase activator NlpD